MICLVCYNLGMKTKYILAASALLFTLFTFADTKSSQVTTPLLPAGNVFTLPVGMDINSARTVNTVMNPITNEPVLPVFIIKGGNPHFTGQIATVKNSNIQLESVGTNYLPMNTESVAVPNTCNYSINGNMLCFHAASLLIEENNVDFQQMVNNVKVNKKLDLGIMSSSLKFFAATELNANKEPIKYIGVSNDTFNQKLSLLECSNTSCSQKVLVKKTPIAITSLFQIFNNKLYFIINNNVIAEIDLSSGYYTYKRLNTTNITAMAFDSKDTFYIMNIIKAEKPSKDLSFAISKCELDNATCNEIYTEKANYGKYSKIFLGVDSNSLYLMAVDNKRASNMVLVSIPKK